MKKGLTYIVFVVDRSGSMNSIAKDMIGGYNAFIKNQRESKIGKCKVFFYQFDDVLDPVYEDVDVDFVKDLTSENYVPRGSTALYCSLGRTIKKIGERIDALEESEKPEKVLVVTITDGQDNCILRDGGEIHNVMSVKDMIKHQTEVYNWDFVYIGANQDAWSVGESMGVSGNTKLNYVASAGGTAFMFDKLSKSTVQYRSCLDSSKKFEFVDDDEGKITN